MYYSTAYKSGWEEEKVVLQALCLSVSEHSIFHSLSPALSREEPDHTLKLLARERG